MGGRENFKQKKSKKSYKVFGMIEGVHRRAWYIGIKKGGRLRKYKKSSSKVWEEVKCRNIKTREVG